MQKDKVIHHTYWVLIRKSFEGTGVNRNGLLRSNCSNSRAKLILRHIETHFHLADYFILGRDGQTFVGR